MVAILHILKKTVHALLSSTESPTTLVTIHLTIPMAAAEKTGPDKNVNWTEPRVNYMMEVVVQKQLHTAGMNMSRTLTVQFEEVSDACRGNAKV